MVINDQDNLIASFTRFVDRFPYRVELPPALSHKCQRTMTPASWHPSKNIKPEVTDSSSDKLEISEPRLCPRAAVCIFAPELPYFLAHCLGLVPALVQPFTTTHRLYLTSPSFVVNVMLHILVITVPVHSLPLQQHFHYFLLLVVSVLPWLIFEQPHPFPRGQVVQ
ncbi:hypothetical protein B0H14DRAFT_3457360 [Mycena olivaceomarginata]|nr:hypothetical protein B0H14DRAFT_3457360 [Mycena olivaceomarginata]